jgi:hypothetical protein
MNGEDILKRIMDCKPEVRRRTGRPKVRWIDGVLEDIKELGVKDWWTVASDRKAWIMFLREAGIYIVLQS